MIAPFDSAFEALREQCSAAGLRWDDAWRKPLHRLASLLAEQNARTNLVGDATPAGLCEHVVEALAMAAATETALARTPATVVDVGAGAGLEALALALCWPQARVMAVEPRALRHQFIQLAIDELGLANTVVVGKSLHGAALGPTFDLAIARAVWPAPAWLPRARALLSTRGVAGLHGTGPAATFAATLAIADWRVVAARDVPGTRRHAVAVLQPRS
jgi:16S rRNA (guanine527-N7)-methyltransferase